MVKCRGLEFAYHLPYNYGLTISGSVNAQLIGLNGANNVTIDGRVNATGTTKDLTITNTNTGSVRRSQLFCFLTLPEIIQ